MGVIRVHAIMPLHKSLFVCSKIMLFLITDLVFAALMVLFNVGLDGMSVLPAVLVQTAILSLIMARQASAVPCFCGTLSNFHWRIW